MNRNALSVLLVAAQFGLMAMLAGLAAPAAIAGQVPAGAWAILAGGALLGAWSLSSNLPGNFNIRPIPREGGELIQSGPYRWIRHPMYASVIVCGAACAWAAHAPAGWLGLAGLITVLVMKAGFEERWMRARHPHYVDYQARTWRIVPGLY